ncbi:MAG: dienelactone hydrolase family protein [Xanthomonadales bacterium]|nr:dienelactone hydrolase family protein [Xanthomonadales bacterium]
MGDWIPLDTAAGPVSAWLARPGKPPRGAAIVLQEIFGVNPHIRSVADGFAHEGYLALAPALFDPVETRVELDYDDAGTERGVALRNAVGFERAVQVVEAAAVFLQRAGLRVGVVGYCWGGSVAFLANTRLGLPAVSYYGARTTPFLGEPARAPMMFHFGSEDASIPPGAIALHRERQPAAQVFVYPGAGHAFNRDIDPAHSDAGNAALARTRTLAFLAEHAS